MDRPVSPPTLLSEVLANPAPLRAAITAACLRDEHSAVQWLLEHEQVPDLAHQQEVQALALQLVSHVREQRRRAGGIDALMKEFSLDSNEGVALMCLAEALLRIPDRASVRRLLVDQLSAGDWRRHLGRSPSILVNGASLGLLFAAKVLKVLERAPGQTPTLARLLAKAWAPAIHWSFEVAMRRLGRQFIEGRSIEEALANQHSGYRHSYDMLGEAALTAQDAARYHGAYESAIHAIGRASNGAGVVRGPGISIKLSALHPRYCRAQRTRVMRELLPRVRALALLAKKYQIGFTIDAEEAERLELSLDILEALALDADLMAWDGLGFAVQAYQKRAPHVIDYLIDLAVRSRHRLMVRLVKGAYWDREIKRAQQAGLAGYPVYTRKAYTDVSYLVCAQKLLAASQHVFPQFATHNAHAVAQILTWAKCAGVEAYEFQCLHGMGETLYGQLLGQQDQPCRVYAPVGAHQTLLPYLVRRLLENGANSSFVNQMLDQNITSAALIKNPFDSARLQGGAPHPALGLPRDLFGAERQNSAGIDLGNEDELRLLAQGLARFEGHYWCAQPLLACGHENRIEQAARVLRNPALNADCIGEVIDAGVPELDLALACASAGAAQWQATGPALRAQALLRGAVLFETHRIELLALLLREAGKTLPNALAEVREAVDFLRYYAAQVQHGPNQAALGVVACISPWNFPLAIFSGQIGAALACGNVVLAKPAEQTPLIAWRAVQLLHQAGIPRFALQFLPGRGAVLGAGLCRAAGVKGVLFTGSLAVAQEINRTLARRAFEQAEELMLIAETGGQNAMIVDASSLPEQVVQDILDSAFDSAGQRCSALRVVFLQQEIAEQIIVMLKGAMQELTIGNPARLSTDIGPVIDDAARQALLAHIAQAGRLSGSDSSLSPDLSPGPDTLHGTFLTPVLIEITALAELEHEVFGPVLHIIRFADDQLERVIDDINRSAYGLTLGIHCRIQQRIDFISQHAHVGNIYVNRNMVGAVVGAQPFGGEGKSGTGPKAGGPLYAKRLQRDPPALAELEASCQPSSDQNSGQSAHAAALDEFFDWASSHGFEHSAGLIAHYRRSSLPGSTLQLPGPVGERNTLTFIPRGKVLCAATSSKVLLNQLAAVLASGNQALVLMLDPGPLDALIRDALPPLLAARIDWCDSLEHCAEQFQVALLEAFVAAALKPALAARPGALIVTLDTTADDAIPLFRLLVERCLCINTSAAGGNASLMTLPP